MEAGSTNGICTAGFSSSGKAVSWSPWLRRTILVVLIAPAASSSVFPVNSTAPPERRSVAVTVTPSTVSVHDCTSTPGR